MSDNEARLVSTSLQSTAEETLILENYVESGLNKHKVTCQFCSSNILNPGSGKYKKGEFDLPKAAKKKSTHEESSSQEVDYEQLTHFWQVPDMYTFENIGFSHNVGDIKYLACADCEIGPIGYYEINSKVSYVALVRVNHLN